MKAMFQTTVLGLLAITMVACSSPQKLLQKENFDDSISKAIKRVRGSKNRAKLKNLAIIGEAYYQANQRNLLSVEQLKNQQRPEHWKTINALYKRMIARQNKVAPYIIQAQELGVDVSGHMDDYSTAELHSRNQAALYEYTEAQTLLTTARSGDMIAARRAYARLNAIDQYFRTFKDSDQLKEEAIELGREDILVTVINQSQAIIPDFLADRLLNVGVHELDDIFHKFHISAGYDVEYDAELNIIINDMAISPESDRTNTYVDSKEVKDGFDYVLDADGNVAKDTSGNDIKIDRYKTIEARVREIAQFKSVGLYGTVSYVDISSRRLLDESPISGEVVFENFTASYRGDREALTSESRDKIGNQPLPFPSTEVMIEDAIELMRPAILDEIDRMKIR